MINYRLKICLSLNFIFIFLSLIVGNNAFAASEKDVLSIFNDIQKGDLDAISKHDNKLKYLLSTISNKGFNFDREENQKEVMAEWNKIAQDALIKKPNLGPFPMRKIYNIRTIYPPGAILTFVESNQSDYLFKIAYGQEKPWIVTLWQGTLIGDQSHGRPMIEGEIFQSKELPMKKYQEWLEYSKTRNNNLSTYNSQIVPPNQLKEVYIIINKETLDQNIERDGFPDFQIYKAIDIEGRVPDAAKVAN